MRICYLSEMVDAVAGGTCERIPAAGGTEAALTDYLADPRACSKVVERDVGALGDLDIVVEDRRGCR